MTGPRVDSVCRVLALRANGIGDFLMVVPALEAVRSCYPDAEVTVVGDAWLPALLDGRPGPWDRCLVAPAFPGLRGLPTDAAPGQDAGGFFEEQQARGYDLALQLHGGGATSNTFVSRLGAGLTAGARAPGAPPLDRWVRYLPGRHEVLRWLDVAALVGAELPGGTARLVPRLVVTGADLERSRVALPGDRRFVALHVGARDLRRRWPTERFVAVARMLLGEGLDVVLVGGDADREASAEVVAALTARADGECVDLSGRLSLPATLGTLARAELFVGNDSGPRHLAAAAGTPTVGVFWVGNVMSFGPLAGDRDRALVSFRMHCPVCGAEQVHHRCDHDVPFVGDVNVAEVGEAALDLLAMGGLDRGAGAGPVGRDGSLRPRRPRGGAPGRAGSTDPATPA